MGTTLGALIEYDRCHLYAGGADKAPFAEPTDDVLSFIDYTGLSHGKDYSFFAAISGWRNESGIQPLFALRGLPDNPSSLATESFAPSSEWTGWLKFSEVQAALEHMHLPEGQLSLPVRVLIAAMRQLTADLGDDRVRLVFELG